MMEEPSKRFDAKDRKGADSNSKSESGALSRARQVLLAAALVAGVSSTSAAENSGPMKAFPNSIQNSTPNAVRSKRFDTGGFSNSSDIEENRRINEVNKSSQGREDFSNSLNAEDNIPVKKRNSTGKVREDFSN